MRNAPPSPAIGPSTRPNPRRHEVAPLMHSRRCHSHVRMQGCSRLQDGCTQHGCRQACAAPAAQQTCRKAWWKTVDQRETGCPSTHSQVPRQSTGAASPPSASLPASRQSAVGVCGSHRSALGHVGCDASGRQLLPSAHHGSQRSAAVTADLLRRLPAPVKGELRGVAGPTARSAKGVKP